MTARRRPRASHDGALAVDVFTRLLPEPSWASWRTVVKALFGLALTPDELAVFRELTGRQTSPTKRAREAFVIVGRRAGKSRIASALAVWAACIPSYRLAPGERGVVMLLAADRRQAGILKSYISAMIKSIPEFAPMILNEIRESIELDNSITIEIHTSSFRSVRGRTVVLAVVDEIAFLPTDESAAEPDKELVNALRPALATTNGLLLCLSSPFSQRGVLYNAYRDHFGREDSETLVIQAATRTMNATIPQALVDQALADDAAAAGAEWLAQFRTDLESLFSRDALDAVVVPRRFELAPAASTAYLAFVDPSGGSSDSFTLAIAHRATTGVPILDLVRESRPPFSPETVTNEFATLVKRYGVTKVYGDRYAGSWVSEQFARHGLAYEASELTRSELYLELLPCVNSGGVELLDNPRLIAQLASLERRVGRSGKDSIDHRPGAHDDLANSTAGALVTAVRSVGLKASWPAEFSQCLLERSDCVLVGGTYMPNIDPHCRRYCCGLKAAESAHAHHVAHGGTLDFRAFVDQHFADNDFVNRLKYRRRVRAFEDAFHL